MADRKESAADITVSVGDESEVVVERLTVTKNIDIEEIRGSGRVLPDGYAITAVSYQGTMELAGNRRDLEAELFDENGIPEESTINITHFNGDHAAYTEVLATSEGYEVNDGQSTTTTYEFIAMGYSGPEGTDIEP